MKPAEAAAEVMAEVSSPYTMHTHIQGINTHPSSS